MAKGRRQLDAVSCTPKLAIDFNMIDRLFSAFALLVSLVLGCSLFAQELSDDRTVRVFIFAGQSNMVGSDSRVQDIKRYPPFSGLESPQENVRFSYSIGRENKTNSNGWVDLQPVNNNVGPELSFARKTSKNIKHPIAIIKCAAGGTHLGVIGIRTIRPASRCNR